jgi:DNA-binding IclR family transcriptional regulator
MPRAAPTPSKTIEAEGQVPTLREPRYSQSLERGLAILGCFTPDHPVLGIADIADNLGMSRSTTHRYVITLVALGYLEQGASRKYRLGMRVTDLGMSALNSIGLREHSHSYLEELRQRMSWIVRAAFGAGRARLTSICVRGRGCRRTAPRWGRCCWRIFPRRSGAICWRR